MHVRTKRGWTGVLLAVGMLGCRDHLSGDRTDWIAPRVTRVEVPRGAAENDTPEIGVTFDEPLDPASVTEEMVLLVAHAAGEPCTTELTCAGGSCFRGECQRSLVSRDWVSDFVNPPLSDARKSRSIPVALTLDAGATVLRLVPRVPLRPNTLHTLLIAPQVTDVSGNRAVPSGSDRLLVYATFASGVRGSGRPSMDLASPRVADSDIPTNLRRVVLQFSEPVLGVTAERVKLSDEQGRVVPSTVLLQQQDGSPAQCSGAPPGTCATLLVEASLAPATVYHLAPGEEGILDAAGQPLLPPYNLRFATGVGEDHEPPRLAWSQTVHADQCLIRRVRSWERADLWFQGEVGTLGAAGVDKAELEAFLPRDSLASGTRALTVVVQDLAGNRLQEPLAAPLEPWAKERIVITEVLLNPLGPEPQQEFVELTNLGTTSVDLADWVLDDGDDGLWARHLPTAVLLPGQRAVVVGSGFVAGTGGDPVPDSRAVLIRLEGSLGQGGLSNRGEAIALKNADHRMVSFFGAHFDLSAERDNGRSVERIDELGCDVAENWRLTAPGRSTPGWREVK